MRTKIPAALATVKPHEGQKLIILCPGYWGKGDTPQEAVANMEFSLDVKNWAAYSVDPSTYVDGDGMWCRDRGTPAAVMILNARGETA